MPTPQDKESKKDFVGRCIPELVKEGKDQKQAVAICYSMWEEEKKKADVVAKIGDEEIVFRDIFKKE